MASSASVRRLALSAVALCLWPHGLCGQALSDSLVVHAGAPALWYTPVEPLPTLERATPLPCDSAHAAQTTPLVYWRIISRKELEPGAGVRFRVRYYVYYPRDAGFHGHPRDLEFADVDSEWRCTGGVCVFRIERVEASAHHTPWVYNIWRRHEEDVEHFRSVAAPSKGDQARFTSARRLPPSVVLFVEEGKHAMAPDRDGDGHYSPGFDVNQRMSDAWGVRDVISAGVIGAARYSAWMTKPRTGRGVILSAEPVDDHSQRFLRRQGELGVDVVTYALVPAADVADPRFVRCIEALKPAQKKDGGPVLQDRLGGLGFFGGDGGIRFPNPMKDFEFIYDRGPGYSLRVGSWHLDAVGSWVVGRVDLSHERGLAAGSRLHVGPVIIESAAGWAAWYVMPRVEFEDVLEGRFANATLGLEAGYKFRIPKPINWGLRLGLAARGFEHVTDFRFVMGIGRAIF